MNGVGDDARLDPDKKVPPLNSGGVCGHVTCKDVGPMRTRGLLLTQDSRRSN